AASIALVDEAGETLEFVVSYGAGSESVVGMRIPVNRGIAGYVAMTGQPLATSNVQKDQRFAGDVAQGTGYVPRSILATPLLSGERVIGVMEVLDKISAPSFGMEDMELLGLFARQATMAITQAQLVGRLSEAFLTELSKLAENSGGESAAVDLRGVLEEGTGTLGTGGLVRIADAFYEISSLGESEQRACLEVLAAFARYAKSKTIPW
ncbi:MAG TPA: GAF domain-containing protein, partial [Anaerolineaceae bacterium]